MNDIERAIDTCIQLSKQVGEMIADDLSISAVQALEKQIPKKVLAPLTFGSVGTCIVCSAAQIVRRNYCYHCGQKLDWTDPVSDKLQVLLDRENER
jgi:hypothetical protein